LGLMGKPHKKYLPQVPTVLEGENSVKVQKRRNENNIPNPATFWDIRLKKTKGREPRFTPQYKTGSIPWAVDRGGKWYQRGKIGKRAH